MTGSADSAIAVIGMAGRFPGAPDLGSYWSNLERGVESIKWRTDEELGASGLSAEAIADPSYVKAFPELSGAADFDARFFNLSAKEVEYIDPQHRVFLECAVHALENAACDPKRYGSNVGVFGGTNPNSYQLLTLRSRILSGAFGSPTRVFETLESDLMFFLGGDKDYLATRVSYKLDLRGPSLTVQTACSTSLVAVHLACQSLLLGECDVALAGAVSATPGSYLKLGYAIYSGMTSPDGHCRPFDDGANGTIFGDGVGVLVLKRLDRAIADRDNIRAVIRGSAINNDGSSKVGYAAPSLEGQASVIVEALAVAGVSASTIDYVEAHGTGTSLGDPIEVASLTRAFQRSTSKKGFCGLGSVKSNIGHLNTAAGVAGLIKVILALENERIPPSINFTAANRQIVFEDSPFQVVSASRPWPRTSAPRRAGVNAFGVGGTNAHVVVEEAPVIGSMPSRRHWHVLPISAKSATALRSLSESLIERLSAMPDGQLADVAHTLAVGRSAHKYRRAVVCSDMASAIEGLGAPTREAVAVRDPSPVCFMFPGQGAQRINMGRGLYESEPAYRAAFEKCADILRKEFIDLPGIVFSDVISEEAASERLRSTELAQPALFSVSYALAALWEARGIRPVGMIGHSVGEFVAACLAGVMRLEEALRVVVARGRLMQQQPVGSMLIVPVSSENIGELIGSELSIAAFNAPNAVVVSGREAAISALEVLLRQRGISGARLRTSHAFHSTLMDGAVAPFVKLMGSIELQPPKEPYVSNVTGTWITAEQAINPDYWGEQLRAPVRFADGLATLLTNAPGILLEVGAGRSLTVLARQNTKPSVMPALIASLPAPGDSRAEQKDFHQALADAWVSGGAVDLDGQYDQEERCKVELPGYPFERETFLPPVVRSASPNQRIARNAPTQSDPSRSPGFILAPYWKSVVRPAAAPETRTGERWLVFAGEDLLSARIIAELKAQGANVASERAGRFSARRADEANLEGVDPAEFVRLLSNLQQQSWVPERIVYLWSLDAPHLELAHLERGLDGTFFALMYLVQALDGLKITTPITIAVVVSESVDVVGGESINPSSAIARGPALVTPLEYKNVSCVYVDVPAAANRSAEQSQTLAEQIISNAGGKQTPPLVACRQGREWTVALEQVALADEQASGLLRSGGVYLISGGLGDLGLAVASSFADRANVNLVLCGRTVLPPREEWDEVSSNADEADRVGQIIRRIRKIERKGSRVIVGTADVSNLDSMRRVVDDVRSEFGAIHGVIHAAGLAGHDIILSQTKSKTMPVFLSKVAGLIVINEILAGDPLDFFVMFSSLSAIGGGVGMLDYAAANAYLDAFAAQRQGICSKTRVVSINWDVWSEFGMATRLPDGLKGAWRARLAEDGIATQEGIDALMRIVGSGLSQAIVSKTLGRAHDPRGPYRSVTESQAGGAAGGAEFDASSSTCRMRPNVGTAYAEPSNEIERIVAECWASALNLDRVGAADDFFELGGDSLLAMQMIPKLVDRFQIELAPRDLFEGGSVAGIARLIEGKLLDEVEALEDV